MCTNSSHVCFYCSPRATLCLTARCHHQPFVLFPTLLNASIAVHTHRGLIRTMPQIALESHHKGMSPRSRRGWLCVHLCVCVCICVCVRAAGQSISVSQYAAVTCGLCCTCKQPSILVPTVRLTMYSSLSVGGFHKLAHKCNAWTLVYLYQCTDICKINLKRTL